MAVFLTAFPAFPVNLAAADQNLRMTSTNHEISNIAYTSHLTILSTLSLRRIIELEVIDNHQAQCRVRK